MTSCKTQLTAYSLHAASIAGRNSSSNDLSPQPATDVADVTPPGPVPAATNPGNGEEIVHVRLKGLRDWTEKIGQKIEQKLVNAVTIGTQALRSNGIKWAHRSTASCTRGARTDDTGIRCTPELLSNERG